MMSMGMLRGGVPMASIMMHRREISSFVPLSAVAAGGGRGRMSNASQSVRLGSIPFVRLPCCTYCRASNTMIKRTRINL
jgi:hypothetical protein